MSARHGVDARRRAPDALRRSERVGARARRRDGFARLVAGVCLTLGVLGLVGAAWAHEDLPIVDATFTLAPGETATFPTAIHYHRIVGSYAVTGAGGNVSLALVGMDPSNVADAATSAPSSDDATAPAAPDVDVPLVVGAASAGTLNTLIRCCDGITWTPSALIARNDGDEPTTVQLRAMAVHDDFAVIVDRAESGAVEVPLAIFLALGLTATGVGWRRRRGRGPSPLDARLPSSFRWSAGLFVGSSAIAVGLAVAGMIRYGAGPVDGMVAILADVPVPGGPFGARDAMVMGVLLLAWSTAIGLWIRSVHVGALARSAWAGRLGVALGVVSLLGSLLMGWTYDKPANLLLLGLVLAVPLIGVVLALGGAPRPEPAEAPRSA